MRSIPLRLALSLAATLLVFPVGHAGVVDSPLPAPFTEHVFTVPGVIGGAGLATFFSCTNLDAAAVTVGVECFGSPGGAPFNDAAATSLSVNPGGTVMFGTSIAVGLSVNSSLGCGPLGTGSARVLATSKKLACTAFVADNGNAPPTSSWQLTIIKGTKQKAFN
jgi:hypothetical protein